MKFIFPKPPTTNNIYKITSRGKFARIYIGPEGAEWFKRATEVIRKAYRRKKPIETECEIFINIFTSTRRDVDGSIKPIMDSMEKNGVIKNDVLFTAVHATREKCRKGEDRAEVEVWELN